MEVPALTQCGFLPARAEEKPELAAWLSSEEWPYHGRARLGLEQATRLVDAEGYLDGEAEVFWIVLEDTERVGLLRLFDLDDDTPLFDLRILSAYRGRGLGRRAVEWLTRYIFEKWPGKGRIEAHTRQDNLAMRGALRRCGYVKEAHHRQAWPDQAGARHDSCGYAILRQDWESGSSTPVRWEE